MVKNVFKTFKKEDFFNRINLHIHSNCSDGILGPDEIIKKALKEDMSYFSITDHNTFLAYEKIKTMSDNLITGIEFDCFFDLNLPHILGYGVDINNEELKKLTKPYKDNLFKRILHARNPKTVIKAIHNAGGIAVLAHPCCYWCINLDRFIEKFVKMGIDGLEVYYPYNRAYRLIKFHHEKTVFELSEKYNLLKTGGMDTHDEIIKGAYGHL